jgi:hypothetical protein
VDPVPGQLLFFLVVPGIEPGPPDVILQATIISWSRTDENYPAGGKNSFRTGIQRFLTCHESPVADFTMGHYNAVHISI